MARPTKQGVDYFPLDVYMDDKFKFIEIKFKLEGFAIVIKLMQRIYANGYWCKWTEDEMLLFSDETKTDPDFVQNVVLESLKRGIFHYDLFLNCGILTSKGIQKRYKEMIRRRKDVEWITEYLLIDGINEVIDDINTTLSEHDDGKSTQSKVNKIKQDNIKQKDISAIEIAFDSFWKVYPRKLDKKKAFEKFKVAAKKHDLQIIILGAMNYAKQCEVKKTDKQYIKHPTSFLNAESFLNEFETEGRNNGTNQSDPYKDQYVNELGF